MTYQQTILANGQYYHVFNRGVEKRHIFLTKRDYIRFTDTITHYLNPKNTSRFSFTSRSIISKIIKHKTQSIELLCYVLMPNHFHLLVKQVTEKGITNFLSKITNSYTKYFNTKHKRVGPLFQGSFKSVRIIDNEQLLHLSRYIHLNPLTDYLTEDLDLYDYSSFPQYSGNTNNRICNTKDILSQFKTTQKYKNFVLDQKNYMREIKKIERLTLEHEQVSPQFTWKVSG